MLKNKISIVVVNYNGKNQTINLLKSINKLDYPKDKIETIIIDNNSQDDSIRTIKKRFPQIIFLKNKKNIGYGPAVNIGARKANSKYILILNNDITLSENFLNEILKTFKTHKKCIVGPKLIIEGRNKHSWIQYFSPWTGKINMRHKKINRLTETQWIQGCAMFTTKRILKSLNYFDEGFAKIFFEDLDLCLRAQKKNIETLVNPQVVCHHIQSYTIKKIPNHEKLFYWYKNKIRFIIKHGNPFQIISVTAFTLLSALYWQVIKKQPNLKSFFQALVWNLKNLKQTQSLRN